MLFDISIILIWLNKNIKRIWRIPLSKKFNSNHPSKTKIQPQITPSSPKNNSELSYQRKFARKGSVTHIKYRKDQISRHLKVKLSGRTFFLSWPETPLTAPYVWIIAFIRYLLNAGITTAFSVLKTPTKGPNFVAFAEASLAWPTTYLQFNFRNSLTSLSSKILTGVNLSYTMLEWSK